MAVRFTFDREKALAAIVYLSSQGITDLSKGKLCKLIFLADKHHLVRFGRPVTGDRICALKDGPVPSNILNMLNELLQNPGDPTLSVLSEAITIDRMYFNPHFRAKQQFSLGDFLSASDIGALDAVVKEFGGKTFSELRSLTHGMTAYKNAWDDRTNKAPDMKFEDLFEDDDDAIEGAREEMIENFLLERAIASL